VDTKAWIVRLTKKSGFFDLILHAVALPFDDHGFSVVQESVEHGAGQGAVVVEDFGPAFIRLVGGQQDGSPLVTLADDLEEQICAGFVGRQGFGRWEARGTGQKAALGSICQEWDALEGWEE